MDFASIVLVQILVWNRFRNLMKVNNKKKYFLDFFA